ncbi:hypothetical protein DHEL01_v208694 [Diaporthe helianthi]|uniref:Uncharacterized protein n=1 Tax=Diaporthe helianthi TaxID=158607 RepID=A0A2P5HRR1_DIAHE|nr:hypothetical protein DHEL01_v208694 [Diaporthe helianthi]
MASQLRTALAAPTVDEGHVACSPTQWAQMVLASQSIAAKDPQKNNKLWDFGIRDHAFSSGSDLTKEDYLRLRVLWYTWPDQRSFRSYMRDNPALLNDDQQSTPYTGYITPENDSIADAIYNAIRPKLQGYLSDIRRVGKGDATRPSGDCGIFYMARYWQGLVSLKLKEVYDENDKKKHFRGKVRKSEMHAMPQAALAGPSRPPQTPTKQTQPRQPHEGFGTPALDAARASAGGLQNPATADETYVNTALLLLLQTVTRLVTDLEESHRAQGSPATTRGSPPPASKAAAATVSSQPTTSTLAIRPAKKISGQDQTRLPGSQGNPKLGSAGRGSRQADPPPPTGTSQPGAPASSPKTTKNQEDDNKKEGPPDPLTKALSQVTGLRHLDWLADRLPLYLLDQSSKATSARKIMEARVDGYLCRRDFVPGGHRDDDDDDEMLEPRFNGYPLAILEAKPFTRLSALSAIRWQESAEIASWVSGLDDKYESVGLLQSSTSGRKRRLLISQDRHELWIIIAEYGDEWKHYIRGNKMTRPADFNQSQDVKALSGSEGFVSMAQDAAPDRFAAMMNVAKEARGAPRGSTRTSRGPGLELPGPEYFCIMQQWGPYKTGDAATMDFFIRRLIGLQVQLLQNWPVNRFENPFPR